MKREKKRTGARNKIIIAVSCTAALIICFIAAGLAMPKKTIANHVYAGNTHLGGMTKEEAEHAINSDLFMGKTIGITSGGHSTKFKSEDILLVADGEKTAEKAFNVGKSKNIFKNSADFFCLLFGKKDVGIVPDADTESLDYILYTFGTTFNGEFVDYRTEINGDTAQIYPREAGQDPNTEKARTEVLSSIEAGIFENINVTLEKSEAKPITVDELYDIIHAEPADAEYEYNENEIAIKESVTGVDVDKSELSKAAELLNSGSVAAVKVSTIAPKVSTELLQSKLFNTTLASYSTSYSLKAANRASNVALAASKINGKVLKPGEVFSYNETIGDTTIANGYKVAPVFENGKSSEGVGGGICQVSSTLYSAVLYADLKVNERRNHSLTVAYVPKGQDATVSYGAIDFKFTNSTDYPIKIKASTGGGKVNVSIVGTKRDAERTVQLRHAIVTTTPPTNNEVNDATLPANTRKVTSAGKTGYVVDTYKTVIENGQTISSGKITRSTYKMVPTEIAVGTKTEAPVYAVPSPAPTEAPEEIPEDNSMQIDTD